MIHLAKIKSLVNFTYGINNFLPVAVYLKVAYFNLHFLIYVYAVSYFCQYVTHDKGLIINVWFKKIKRRQGHIVPNHLLALICSLEYPHSPSFLGKAHLEIRGRGTSEFFLSTTTTKVSKSGPVSRKSPYSSQSLTLTHFGNDTN